MQLRGRGHLTLDPSTISWSRGQRNPDPRSRHSAPYTYTGLHHTTQKRNTHSSFPEIYEEQIANILHFWSQKSAHIFQRNVLSVWMSKNEYFLSPEMEWEVET